MRVASHRAWVGNQYFRLGRLKHNNVEVSRGLAVQTVGIEAALLLAEQDAAESSSVVERAVQDQQLAAVQVVEDNHVVVVDCLEGAAVIGNRP